VTSSCSLDTFHPFFLFLPQNDTLSVFAPFGFFYQSVALEIPFPFLILDFPVALSPLYYSCLEHLGNSGALAVGK